MDGGSAYRGECARSWNFGKSAPPVNSQTPVKTLLPATMVKVKTSES